MTDETAAAPAAADRPQARLRLHTQFLRDLSFENPQGARSIARTDEKPQIQVNLNVDSHQLQESFYEIALKITVNSAKDEEPWFLVELDYRGVFSLTGADEKSRAPVLLIEGPRMLFPFARRIIADVVRDGGFPPLLMEPVDFVSLYRQHAMAQPARSNGEDRTAENGQD